jgi:hypothetical protein
MNKLLWEMIQRKSETVALCYAFLEDPRSQQESAIPIRQTVEKIIRDELDQINALKLLFEKTGRTKSSTGCLEFAEKAYNGYIDSRKLIK